MKLRLIKNTSSLSKIKNTSSLPKIKNTSSLSKINNKNPIGGAGEKSDKESHSQKNRVASLPSEYIYFSPDKKNSGDSPSKIQPSKTLGLQPIEYSFSKSKPNKTNDRRIGDELYHMDTNEFLNERVKYFKKPHLSSQLHRYKTNTNTQKPTDEKEPKNETQKLGIGQDSKESPFSNRPQRFKIKNPNTQKPSLLKKPNLTIEIERDSEASPFSSHGDKIEVTTPKFGQR